MINKVFDIMKFSLAVMASKIIKVFPKYRDVWLITERRAECKDNGYHLFKYLRTNHPDINVFYAIDKNSYQRKKIIDYGNVVNFNSFKHYVLALTATKLIGAFLPCGIPDSISFYKFVNMVKGKKCFLQHGITKENIKSLHYERTQLDLFICGAKPEYDYILQNFGYQKENVKYSGFCRYDNLNEFNIEKLILIMPTWRQWIPSSTWHEKESLSDLSSIEYFENYKKLINDKKILSLLERHGYRIIFYIHHEMQPYIDYFGKSNDIITIASENEYDVQDLLKSASFLITDYSSVAFDFAYMKKPLIYYQFDEDKYYKNHYNKGYFDYGDMGFGQKCSNLEQVILEMESILEKGCNMNEIYKRRVDNFFLYRDKNNCERNYKAISNI